MKWKKYEMKWKLKQCYEKCGKELPSHKYVWLKIDKRANVGLGLGYINRLPAKQNVRAINIIKEYYIYYHTRAWVCVWALKLCVKSTPYSPKLNASYQLPIAYRNAAHPAQEQQKQKGNFNTRNKIRTKYAVKLNWKENRYGWHKQKESEQPKRSERVKQNAF